MGGGNKKISNFIFIFFRKTLSFTNLYMEGVISVSDKVVGLYEKFSPIYLYFERPNVIANLVQVAPAWQTNWMYTCLLYDVL